MKHSVKTLRRIVRMRQAAKTSAKACIVVIVRAERALFFRTGVRLPLLRKYFAWESRRNQAALDRRAVERDREMERRMTEIEAHNTWRQVSAAA